MAEIMQYQKKRDDNPAFREALRKIWLSGFDDAPGYFDFFYEKRVRTGQAEIFCALSGAQAVGAAYFLPAEIRRPGVTPQKAYYGYAFAILPEYRGKGYGKAILKKLAEIAVERKCGRLEWSCLDWNKPSIDFYLSLDAEPMSDWTVYRLTGDRLKKLAQ